jgi:uncharacterized Rmd1/YagE family protein
LEVGTQPTAATSGEPSDSFGVRALLVGARLDTKSFESADAIAVTPLTLRVPGGGTALLFRYGAVVLVGVRADAEARLLDHLAARVAEPVSPVEVEQAVIHVWPGAEDRVDPDGTITVQALTTERLQIIASALAKSVVLGYYEERIAGAFDRIEPLAERLRRSGALGARPRELLRQIGAVLKTQQVMVGRVEVEESPELLWLHPELNRLYARLVEEYELRERSRAIERKLVLVQESVGTLLDLVQNQRSERLELLVIALIGIEILLTLFDTVQHSLH